MYNLNTIDEVEEWYSYKVAGVAMISATTTPFILSNPSRESISRSHPPSKNPDGTTNLGGAVLCMAV